MHKQNSSISTAITRTLALCVLFSLPFAMAATGQKTKCKKWTYDFSETVKYSDTALEACKNYVKEKYANDNYKASVEATGDPEMYRCSAGDTYIGLVYQRECATCCKKPSTVFEKETILTRQAKW